MARSGAARAPLPPDGRTTDSASPPRPGTACHEPEARFRDGIPDRRDLTVVGALNPRRWARRAASGFAGRDGGSMKVHTTIRAGDHYNGHEPSGQQRVFALLARLLG